MKKLLLLVMAVVMVTGCSITPQQIFFTPKPATGFGWAIGTYDEAIARFGPPARELKYDEEHFDVRPP